MKNLIGLMVHLRRMRNGQMPEGFKKRLKRMFVGHGMNRSISRIACRDFFSFTRTEERKDKIEGLIRNVANLMGVQFIRNGSAYDAADAAKFLRGEWQSKEKEIHTVEDFIEKVATISSTTGKPYWVRFSDGREVKCADYLKGVLKP